MNEFCARDGANIWREFTKSHKCYYTYTHTHCAVHFKSYANVPGVSLAHGQIHKYNSLASLLLVPGKRDAAMQCRFHANYLQIYILWIILLTDIMLLTLFKGAWDRDCNDIWNFIMRMWHWIKQIWWHSTQRQFQCSAAGRNGQLLGQT